MADSRSEPGKVPDLKETLKRNWGHEKEGSEGQQGSKNREKARKRGREEGQLVTMVMDNRVGIDGGKEGGVVGQGRAMGEKLGQM